jgi:hypothetical protein
MLSITMTNNSHQMLQPPHARTVESLVSELQDRIERDQQFIALGEELLARWRITTDQMQQRFSAVLSGRRRAD